MKLSFQITRGPFHLYGPLLNLKYIISFEISKVVDDDDRLKSVIVMIDNSDKTTTTKSSLSLKELILFTIFLCYEILKIKFSF